MLLYLFQFSILYFKILLLVTSGSSFKNWRSIAEFVSKQLLEFLITLKTNYFRLFVENLIVTHNVELSNNQTYKSDRSNKEVSTNRIIVSSSSLSEVMKSREEFVLGYCLEDPGCSLQWTNGRWQRCRKASGIDERTPRGHDLHHLLTVDLGLVSPT